MADQKALSGYRAMWLFVMFDLPVKTKLQRKHYSQFRTQLVRSGFAQLQFSVYAHYFVDEEASHAKRKLIQESLPPKGQVRFLAVTDRQFGKMQVFFGKSETHAESPPDQLMLF
jgi:CRISPR-associated protein Cas2